MEIRIEEPVFEVIRKASANLDLHTYVVGGYVRDLLLGRPSRDIDVAVIGSGIGLATEVSRLLGKQASLSVFKSFGTAMIRFNELEIEFVGARKESYRADSRKPVVEDGSMEDDLMRRDFTINALAIDLSKTDNDTVFGEEAITDLFGGLQHLQDRLLKTPLEPSKTYSDDPLRMLRAIRFSCQLNFTIDMPSLEAIKQNADRIKIISAERIRDELNKIILSDRPSAGFKHLLDTGLLACIFPEMVALKGVDTIEGKSHKDNFYHTLEVLDNVSRQSNNLWLRWAAILHDIAKPLTKRFDPEHGFTFHGHEDKGARMTPGIFRRLALPMGESMAFVEKLVLLHLRPIVLARETVTDSAVRRLLFEAGDAIDDLMALCHADVTTKNEFKAKKYRDNFQLVRDKLRQVEERDRVRNWQPPVSGLEIMEFFKIPEGKNVGLLKTFIREAILDGLIPNEKQAALDLLKQKGAELGLKPDLN